MNLSSVAINRPVFTTMCAAGVLILGIMSLNRLGTDLFPDVAMPVVAVTTTFSADHFAALADAPDLVVRDFDDYLARVAW